MATQIINRYSLGNNSSAEFLAGAQKMALKYCEFCGLPFCTDALEARCPGELIPMQRAAGKRPPIVCRNCQENKIPLAYMQEEARTMKRVALEIMSDRAQREAKIHAQVLEEQKLAQQRRAPQVAPEKKDTNRKFRFAKWREPLMKAFRERGELTAREIATIIGVQPGAPASQIYIVPQRVRSAGIPIVVVGQRLIEQRHGPRFVRLFGLSTAQELTPLTPPKDEVTNQFMREVQA